MDIQASSEIQVLTTYQYPVYYQDMGNHVVCEFRLPHKTVNFEIEKTDISSYKRWLLPEKYARPLRPEQAKKFKKTLILTRGSLSLKNAINYVCREIIRDNLPSLVNKTQRVGYTNVHYVELTGSEEMLVYGYVSSYFPISFDADSYLTVWNLQDSRGKFFRAASLSETIEMFVKDLPFYVKWFAQ